MPSTPKHNPTLLEHFQELEDPRAVHLIEHQLLDIIALTICAVICGAESWVGLKRVGMVESQRRISGQPPVIERRYYSSESRRWS